MAFKRSAVRSRLSPPTENRGLLSSVFSLVKKVCTPLTSCNIILWPRSGLSGVCAGKVSGSIPLISTKRNSHPKGWLFSFGTGGAESNPDDACKIDEIVYSGVDGSDYQSNDTVNQDAGHKV